MREAKVLVSLRICADSPEPPLIADAIRAEILHWPNYDYSFRKTHSPILDL